MFIDCSLTSAAAAAAAIADDDDDDNDAAMPTDVTSPLDNRAP